MNARRHAIRGRAEPMHSLDPSLEPSLRTNYAGAAEAELLEAVGLALQSVIPCVDHQKHDVDLQALAQIAARAVSAAERLRSDGRTARANGALDRAFEPGSRSLRDLERSHISATLEQCSWVIEGKRGAAQLLGLHPNTLRHRLRKLDLRRPTKA